MEPSNDVPHLAKMTVCVIMRGVCIFAGTTHFHVRAIGYSAEKGKDDEHVLGTESCFH